MLRARFRHQLDVGGAEDFTLVAVDHFCFIGSPAPQPALASVTVARKTKRILEYKRELTAAQS